ncbi:MAG: T9SS type A sorting domain-containing protein [Bacteroidales bacterium]|nr:T9SS type A sorting domain-containing protein [Bacteroidales bacterium]
MKKYFLFSAITLISLLSFSQDWNVSEIGVCPTVYSYDCILADGRNDGINRLYVTTRGGGIYEWTFESGVWSYITIDSGLTNLITIEVGDVRNDGINRLYAGQWNPNKNVKEYFWNGSNWESQIISTEAQAVTCLVIGDIKKSGENSLYVSGFFGNKEYFWNGSSWDITTIPGPGNAVEGPGMIGNGKNDDTLRLYVPQKAGREYSWLDNVYSFSTLNAEAWPESSMVAIGRNDGLNRVYVQDWGGGWECTWNGSSWDTYNFTGISGRGEWYAGITKSDGKMNLYSSMVGLAFKEYSWNETGSQYETNTIVDASTGATSCIAIGSGRNDDTVRIYIPHYSNGGIYEITHINPFVSGSTNNCPIEKNQSISLYPNPSSEFIIIQLPDYENYQYSIFDGKGKNVKIGKIESRFFNKSHTINTKNLSSGIYTIKLSSTKNVFIKKFIINQ